MRKTFLSLTSVIALAVTLSACGPQQAEVTEESQPGTTATTTASAEPTTGEVDAMPKFGDTVTYPDGLKITVKDLGKFEPSETAAGNEGGTPHQIEITLENGSDNPVDPNLLHATASSGGKESNQIFDSEAGLNGAPTTTVLPGKSVTWIEGYAFADPDDVTFEISSFDAGRDSVIYTR